MHLKNAYHLYPCIPFLKIAYFYAQSFGLTLKVCASHFNADFVNLSHVMQADIDE